MSISRSAQRLMIGVGCALFSPLYAAATLSNESFFLHFDNPTQHVFALELVSNCWGYSSKPAITLILAAAYAVLGPNPFWEVLILMGLGAIAMAVFYSLTSRALASYPLGGLASLWLMTLPSYVYYSRNHIAYPTAFFLIAIWLYVRRRLLPAGLFFSLALLSHFGFVVPLSIWICAGLVTQVGPRTRRDHFWLAAGVLIPIAVVEAFDFAYSGIPFQWLKGSLGEIRTYSAVTGTTWASVWDVAVGSNGIHAWLLFAGALASLFLWRRRRIFQTSILTAWGVILAYSVRSGLFHLWLPPKVFAGIYPLLIVAVVASWKEGMIHLPREIRSTLVGLTLVGLAFALVMQGIWLRGFSQTGNLRLSRAFELAQGRPVRFFGNMWVGEFYARRFGVETSINDWEWLKHPADTAAILILQDQPAESLVGLDESRYDIERFATGHEKDIGPAVSGEGDSLPTTIGVWIPRVLSPVRIKPTLPGPYTVYYAGQGCLFPPAYGFGTKHYYQVALEHLLGLWPRP